MKLYGTNPTAHPRWEHVVFGCDKDFPHGEVLKELPDFDIRCAFVGADPFSSGEIVPEDFPRREEDPMEVDYIRLIDSSSRWGEIHKLTEVLASTSTMTVELYTARMENVVSQLIVYRSRLNRHIRVEWIPVVESLTSQDAEMDFKLWFPDWMIPICRTGEFAFKGNLFDMQGLAFAGVILPVEIPSDPQEMSTWKANRDFDLFCTGSWDHRWGPWDKPMMVGGVHPDRNPKTGPLDHRGLILNKRPGDTGDQGGFGQWKGLDALGPKQLFNLIHDYYACLQENCRPITVLNKNGEIPSYAEYPNYRSWSETWDTRITHETFRRTYKPRGRYEGWLQEDEEHYNDATPMLYVAKTTGSFAVLHMAKMKAFHWVKQNRFPTVGRALGRCMMNGITLWKLTGDEEIRNEAKRRFKPAVKNTWISTNGDFDLSLDALKHPYVLRLIQNDPQTGIDGWGWYVWEDVMAAAALDRLSIWLNDPELRLMALFLSRSVVQYGINPEGTQIAKAVQWIKAGELGKQVVWAHDTNYLEWGATGVGVALDLALAHGDENTAEKAAKVIEHIKKSTYWNLDSYLAAF